MYCFLKWTKLHVYLIHFLHDFYWTSYLLINVIIRIINLTFSTASLPTAFKSGVVKPLSRKPTRDCDILKNYGPVSNLPYLSKLIEKSYCYTLGWTNEKDRNYV